MITESDPETIDASLSPLAGKTEIRVLIVDDSPVISTILSAMLQDTPGISVAGIAANGQDAVRQTIRLRPNVITMDIRMPKMDGLEATRQIMTLRPTPIIVVSSSVYATDYNIAFNAIEAGALTVIEKPMGLISQDYDTVREQLVTAVKTMAGVPLVSRHSYSQRKDGIGPMTAMLHSYFSRPIQVIAIAASTGGPPVLMHLLSNLPKDFPIPIVIVQHVLPAFVKGLAEWLNSRSSLPVELAQHGGQLVSGRAYVAPDGSHLAIRPDGTFALEQTGPINGLRPAATRLFESIAEAYGPNAIGIIMSGMGDDGVAGLKQMSQAGGHVIAQDEASCVVFGMSKVALESDIVDEVLSPDEMVTRLIKLQGHLKKFAAHSTS